MSIILIRCLSSTVAKLCFASPGGLGSNPLSSHFVNFFFFIFNAETRRNDAVLAHSSNCCELSAAVPPNPLPSELKPFSISQQQSCLFIYTRTLPKKHQSIVPVARLFGPAIFEASKLKVLFLGTDEKKHPGKLPRTYTLTHCDLTSKLTLAISQTINNSQLQGWYHRLQRDEVIAEWKKVRGKMSLHVHCHISGGHFLLDLCASLRFFIFSKELPVVLKAFVHGDGNLFNNYPELEESLVWVYFHSTFPEFNKVECWGPLKAAAAPSGGVNRAHQERSHEIQSSSCDPLVPHPCQEDCTCCFRPMNMHVHDPSLV